MLQAGMGGLMLMGCSPPRSVHLYQIPLVGEFYTHMYVESIWTWNPAHQPRQLHRIITIREAARSQGFPDHVKFSSVNRTIREITQQIGNAVPVPLAKAIGKEINKARWKNQQISASVESYHGKPRSGHSREQSLEL